MGHGFAVSEIPERLKFRVKGCFDFQGGVRDEGKVFRQSRRKVGASFVKDAFAKGNFLSGHR